MSFKKYKEYIISNTIKKINKNDKYLILIYKPNEEKKEKLEKIKKLYENKLILLDDEKDYKADTIKIFGKSFVKKNKKKCKIIYNNKMFELKEYFHEIVNNYNREIKEIKLKLIGIQNVSKMEEIFNGCYYLTSISEYKIEKNKKCTTNDEEKTKNGIQDKFQKNTNKDKLKSNEIFSDKNPFLSLFEYPLQKEINLEVNNNLNDFADNLDKNYKKINYQLKYIIRIIYIVYHH